MKRYIFLFFFIATSLTLQAKSPIDSCKKRMIVNINCGNFADAFRDIDCVKDWSVSDNIIVDFDSVYRFYDYVKNIQVISLPVYRIDSCIMFIKQISERYICNYEKEDGCSLLRIFHKYSDLITDYSLNICDRGYLSTLVSAGEKCLNFKMYDSAEIMLNKALVLNENSDTIQIPELFAYTLTQLGWLYYELEDFSKAEKYAKWSIEFIQNNTFDEKEYASAANLLGNIYTELCNFYDAEKFLSMACEYRAKMYGKNSIEYVSSLTNLGSMYIDMGKYFLSERLLLQCYQIAKRNNNVYVLAAISLCLGLCYERISDYSQARLYTLQSLVLARDSLHNKSLMAKSLNNLGLISANSEIDTFPPMYYLLQAVELFEEQTSDYARTLENLGVEYLRTGNYIYAEECLLKSKWIFNSIFNNQGEDLFIVSIDLGDLFLAKNDYYNAERQYLSTLERQVELYGNLDYRNEILMYKLFILYIHLNDFPKSQKYLLCSEQLNRHHFIESVDYLTAQQRLVIYKKIKKRYEEIYSNFCFFYYAKESTLSDFAYDNELFFKGVLLSATNAVSRSILESNDTTLIRQWNDLRSKKQQIIALQEKVAKLEDIEYLTALEKEAEQLEKIIVQSSSSFRQSRAQWSITWDSVRTYLADDQVAIEYFSAPLNEDSTMYCALLLRNNSEHPDLIPLFEEKQALSLINTATESQTNCTYEYKIEGGDTIGNGAQLANIVWGKIMPYIHDGETIYFAPSGLLHQLAIEALPYDEARTMADVFNLVRLSSTRELVLNRQNTAHTTATLYGGIQYNMSGDELLAESEQYATTNILASRGIENDTLNRGSVDYLPGSKTEAEHINQMLQQNNLQVQLFTSTTANEESFKALSGTKQNILHIATHGFFWSDSTAHKKEFFAQRMLQSFDRDRPIHPVIDPLNRCGLLLAGANTALSGHSKDLPDGVQDGILTAKEISLLDLREADLVVLSACETGNGEITGDGVFGLQRAFKQAGAQTLILSLWKVNDNATQLLMTEFYRNWITLHQSKREAFRNAQNTVRSQYPEPAYWAGFIMLD